MESLERTDPLSDKSLDVKQADSRGSEIRPIYV
jgi:hypothetical protein